MNKQDIAEVKKLKKEQKLLRVIGLPSVVLGFFIFIVLIGYESPFGGLGMILAVAGMVMIVRSFVHQKFKPLKQEKKELNLSALSQLSLWSVIGGIVLFVVGLIVSSVTDGGVFGVLSLLFGVIILIIGIILTFITAVKLSKEKRVAAPRIMSIKNGGYRGANFADNKNVCARCGIDLALLSKKQMTVVGGNKYCDICASVLTNQASEPHLLCNGCHKSFPKSSLRLVSGSYYCSTCEHKLFSGNASSAAKSNAIPSFPQPAATADSKEKIVHVAKKMQNLGPLEIIKRLCSSISTYTVKNDISVNEKTLNYFYFKAMDLVDKNYNRNNFKDELKTKFDKYLKYENISTVIFNDFNDDDLLLMLFYSLNIAIGNEEDRFSAATYVSLVFRELCLRLDKLDLNFDENIDLQNDYFKALHNQKLFTIQCSEINLPVCYIDRFPLFTKREYAELAIADIDVENELKNWLVVTEINPSDFNDVLSAYYLAGYRNVIINRSITAGIEKICALKDRSFYGVFNPDICNSMICLQEMQLSSIFENQKYYDEKVKFLKSEILQMLGNAALIIQSENQDDVASVKNTYVTYQGGGKWLGVFTDVLALNVYTKNLCKHSKVRLSDVFNEMKKDDTLSGIVVNPGRENFLIERK